MHGPPNSDTIPHYDCHSNRRIARRNAPNCQNETVFAVKLFCKGDYLGSWMDLRLSDWEWSTTNGECLYVRYESVQRCVKVF